MHGLSYGILGRIALAKQLRLFLHVVCQSVVCHVHALCLNRSTDLDATRQVHLRGPMTYCAKWGSLALHGKGIFGELNPAAKTRNCKLQPNSQFYVATWRIQIRSWLDLPWRFRLLPHYFGPCFSKRSKYERGERGKICASAAPLI